MTGSFFVEDGYDTTDIDRLISLSTAAAAVSKAGTYMMFSRIGDTTQTYVGDWT